MTNDLAAAIAAHYGRPADRHRQLEADANAFRPDPAMEAAVAARQGDPARYDADLRRMGASGIPLALYQQRRAAAIELGRFNPEGDLE